VLLSTATDFDRDGYAIVSDVVAVEEIEALTRAIEGEANGPAGLRRDGAVYGLRDALRAVPEVRRLARSRALLKLVRPILGPDAFAVRGLLFDKTPEVNWGVPWHQDLTIAVKKRIETPGFGPWTVKVGIDHVRPLISILEQMVALRVHLDDCDADQGPLEVLRGSHREGRIDEAGTRRWLARERPMTCLVDRGGVVMIRPLILHASSAAKTPRRRRVVHLEYAAEPLPDGLEWFESANEEPL